ncbi:ABC transporter permease [Fibrobacter sp. UWH3]|nr:ABC transporter permease [Fibrobacter sp. UWH3]
MQTEMKLPQNLTAANSKELLRSCRRALRQGALRLDGSEMTFMDYSGDAFFALLAEVSAKTGNRLELLHFNDDIKQHLSDLRKFTIPQKDRRETTNIFEALGGVGFDFIKEVVQVFILLNMCIYWTFLGPFDKGKLRFGGVAKQMFRLGSEATGICFLMVALVCLTMALQSSVMLNTIGAGSYLASGLGFLIFAEIGPLLTTIILAGRSGSSIAAEIANMSVCEEVKAIKTMAISPVQYLVVPRFLAMSVCTPILNFCASIFGCFAGFLIGYFCCDITFTNYLQGIREGIDPMVFAKSSIKALAFGWLVTLISCNKGLNAKGGAEAVGLATTSSVVTSIASIVIADTLFAFIFY